MTQTETATAKVTLVTPEKRDGEVADLRAEGLPEAKRLRRRGRKFLPVILAPDKRPKKTFYEDRLNDRHRQSAAGSDPRRIDYNAVLRFFNRDGPHPGPFHALDVER